MDGSQPNDVKTWDHADSYTLLYLSLRDVFGLFGDCVEMFDVVVQRKNPEHGFALLCTKLCFERCRFIVWGEVIGLMPRDSTSEPGNIMKEHEATLSKALHKVLSDLYMTLAYAEVFVERLSIVDGTLQAQEWNRVASANLPLFSDRTAAVREAIVATRRSEKSPWKASRWTVHNLGAFETLVARIEGLVGALDIITEAFGALDRQASLLTTGIESIRDTTHMQLIRDVASSLKPSPLISIIPVLRAGCSTESPPVLGSSGKRTALISREDSVTEPTEAQVQPQTSRATSLCEACSTISLSMLAHGFRHALDYDQVLQSSHRCRFCTLMLDAYKRQQCVNLTAGMTCDKSHRGRLTWAILTTGPGVRFGMFKLDSGHYSESLALSTHEESILFKSGIFTQRDLQVANSPRNLRLLRDWLRECRSSHEECNRGSYSGNQFDDEACSTQLPFRVIDVGSPDGSQPPRLVTTDYQLTGRYLTLSHCWGKIPPTKTTAATLALWHQALPEKQLSKTFQDAIWFTRQLGERYVWIDSLCIVQDDPKDLEVQIGLMGKIFEGSYCTIAAVDAKGPEGLLEDRGMFLSGPNLANRMSMELGYQDLLTDIRHLNDPYHEEALESLRALDGSNSTSSHEGTHEIFMTWVDVYAAGIIYNIPIEEKAWYSRGWVFQEKELSRRCIYFVEEAVVWKCNRYWESEETGSSGRRKRARQGNLEPSTVGGITYDMNHILRKLWQRVAEEYSRKRLSFIADKDKALKGFEERLVTRCGVTFRFGLLDFGPGDVLLSQLLWIPRLGSRNSLRGNPDFACPTWSWMILEGGVKWAANECLVCPEALCQVGFDEVEPDGRQKLRISGPTRQVFLGNSVDKIPRLSERERWPPHTHFGWTEMMLEANAKMILSAADGDGSEIIGWVVMDTEDEPRTLVAAALLQYLRQDSEEEPMCVEFLAFEEVYPAGGAHPPGGKPTYQHQRVGRGRVLKDAFGWLEGCQRGELMVV